MPPRPKTFQSTPPARGATTVTCCILPKWTISIHAPREGGDHGGRKRHDFPHKFQSTPPARGATLPRDWSDPRAGISIHAPREGGDCQTGRVPADQCISIHAPREGGDWIVLGVYRFFGLFQSTPPARGATLCKCCNCELYCISIHAPREGGDYSTPDAAALTPISIHAPREGGDHCGHLPPLDDL